LTVSPDSKPRAKISRDGSTSCAAKNTDRPLAGAALDSEPEGVVALRNTFVDWSELVQGPVAVEPTHDGLNETVHGRGTCNDDSAIGLQDHIPDMRGDSARPGLRQ